MKFSWVSVMLKAILIAVPVLLTALYAGDYLWLRIRKKALGRLDCKTHSFAKAAAQQ